MNVILNDRYSPKNLIHYNTAVAFAEKLEKDGFLLPCDKRKILTALNRKYGFDSCSIFAA